MHFISLKNVERKLENNEKIRNLMGGVTKLCFTAGIKKGTHLIALPPFAPVPTSGILSGFRLC